jgi:hypothetical protein
MSNIVFSRENIGDSATLTYSSQHPSFPASNVQQRWFKKPWRSKYGPSSNWGLFRIDNTKYRIFFNEGAGIIQNVIAEGDYDAGTLCTAISTAMNTAGATFTYTCSYSDTTKKFTISATGSFSLLLSYLPGSGTGKSKAIWNVLGWVSVVDTASAASHTAEEIRIHTEEELKFDLGAASTIKSIYTKFNNLQSTALAKIIFYSDAFISVAKTIDLTVSNDVMCYFTNDSYRYVKIWFSDPTNPDGFVELGRVWISTYFQPHYGFTLERDRSGSDPSPISSSEDGQESSIQLSKFKEWSYNFDAIKPADHATIDAIFAEIGTSKATFICEKYDATDPAQYCHYVKILSWEWAHIISKWSTDSHWWSLKVTVREER